MAVTLASNIERQGGVSEAARWWTTSTPSTSAAASGSGSRRSARTRSAPSSSGGTGARRAHDRRHLVARLQQLGHEVAAEKPAGARDERPHSRFSSANRSCSRRLAASISAIGKGVGASPRTAA